MRKYRRYIGLLIIGYVVPVFAQVCEIEESGRWRSVAFPSGKTITVAGHVHGETAEVMKLMHLANDTQSSNEQYLFNSFLVMTSLRETLAQHREDVAALKNLIRSGHVNFIALEFGDALMRFMTDNAQTFLPKTRENLKARGIEETSRIDDAFLVFAGPALYLAYMEPELMQKVRVVAVEDDDLMKRSLDAEAAGQRQFQIFQIGNSPEIVTSVGSLWSRIILEYDLHRLSEDDWVLNELKEKIPHSLVAPALVPIKSALAAAELLRKRDAQSSLKVLGQEGSGIFLVGTFHSRSLANIFHNFCLRPG